MQCTKLATFAGLVMTLLAGCFAAQQNGPAKPKVAVLDIRGDKSAELHKTVLEILGEDYAIVNSAAYRDTARELKAKRMKRRHVKKVAEELGVEAVIYGKLVRRGKRKYTLSLRVRDGKTGKLVKKLRVPVRKRRTMSDKNARKLERKLIAVMEDVAPQPLPPEVEDEDEQETAVAKAETKKRKRSTKKSKREPKVAKRKSKPAKPEPVVDPDGIEIEDDYVIVDRLRDGQVIDDEKPPGWK